SGAFLSVTSGLDQALSGAAAARPSQVLSNARPVTPTAALWFNPQAFAQPSLGTYGNLAISNIPGPGTVELDMGLVRIFRIREAQSVHFRMEAFNWPNRVNLMNPTTALNSPTFGKILTTNDPRILQAALKFNF